MATMRTVIQHRLGGPEVLETAATERPEPGPGEVLVRVRAAGTNPVDWKTRERGSMDGSEPPFVLGWDLSGTVAALGEGVGDFAEGDEVYGMPRFPRFGGAYAEYAAAPAGELAPKPARLSHEEAAALPLAGLTALQALVGVADVRAGQRVLVHAAAGGVGHLAVQIAKAKGAYVIGTASAEKHMFLKAVGVDEALDYRSVDFAEVLSGLDVAFNTVGPDYEARSAAVLRDGGTLVSLMRGELPEAERTRITAEAMLVAPDGAGMRALSALVEDGSLTPVVARALPLERAAEAHRLLEVGRTAGKIVLTID
ncbi:NADP-dependent oxidoreductase [Glycomyces paridis]|uniref:NADP-dependent oxidoreductase n=1 Tax=Glycomyces paridis TaxID=2126555 RepID=A0A4S8PJD2_9ACTN|nr:NADP-dependent oxidoreductase [Glycomyces paridis]THV28404.1 NADP-dependent oxidoreductase [Glycomyces paridis]